MQKFKASFACIISFLFSLPFYGQAGFTDNFTDGDFTANPVWIGEPSKFQVNSMNQLQLNDAGAGSSNESYLITSSEVINESSWEFYVKLDFNPSTSNFAKVYLVSDNQDLTQNLNGYFVRIGGASGTVDDISLFRQDGSSDVELIDGADGTASTSPELKVRVTKNASNQWELFVDLSATGSNFQSEGTATDNTYGNSSYFGVFCRYTSTRFDKFTFDDFVVSGVSFQDTIKPRLNAVSVNNNSNLTLSFNEALETVSAENESNYFVNKGIGIPASSTFNTGDSSTINLNFSTPFSNGEEYELIVKNIDDRSGNTIEEDTVTFTYFVPVPADYRDIVINELYPDFTPSIGLPGGEYIELFNASNKVINLENWTLTDGISTATLSKHILRPQQYIIICSSSLTSDFEVFGTTMGVSSFPTLNNSGDNIVLADENGQTIDFVNYTDDWYNDDAKDDGGYSLEQINPFTGCTGINNFSASNAAIGGTPGQQNSAFDTLPDTTPLSLTNATVLSKDSLLISFDESIDSTSIAVESFVFTPDLIVANTTNQAPLYESVIVSLATPLDSGVIYNLVVNGVKDCSGNEITTQNTRSIALPDIADKNDVVINEILFNPRTGGVDFVELYNRSEKVITLKSWMAANEAGDTLANLKVITESPLLFFPGEYLVITEDKANIIAEYPLSRADRIFEISDLPSYNDDEGTVYILNPNQLIIDEVSYTDDMHFPLLSDDDGVSLERVSPERRSDDESNFHSAAESIGFATPGYENSQQVLGSSFSGDISIDPEVFSPDNDGFQDIVTINYQFNEPGFVANVDIYDRNGRKIRSLIKNELLGNAGSFSWNGITDDNTKARIGPYVILIDAFNPNGDKEVYKKVVVVAAQLD